LKLNNLKKFLLRKLLLKKILGSLLDYFFKLKCHEATIKLYDHSYVLEKMHIGSFGATQKSFILIFTLYTTTKVTIKLAQSKIAEFLIFSTQ